MLDLRIHVARVFRRFLSQITPVVFANGAGGIGGVHLLCAGQEESLTDAFAPHCVLSCDLRLTNVNIQTMDTSSKKRARESVELIVQTLDRLPVNVNLGQLFINANYRDVGNKVLDYLLLGDDPSSLVKLGASCKGAGSFVERFSGTASVQSLALLRARNVEEALFQKMAVGLRNGTAVAGEQWDFGEERSNILYRGPNCVWNCHMSKEKDAHFLRRFDQRIATSWSESGMDEGTSNVAHSNKNCRLCNSRAGLKSSGDQWMFSWGEFNYCGQCLFSRSLLIGAKLVASEGFGWPASEHDLEITESQRYSENGLATTLRKKGFKDLTGCDDVPSAYYWVHLLSSDPHRTDIRVQKFFAAAK